MVDAFTKRGLDSPRLMGELLMAHVLGCDRLRLYMEADRPASDLERARLRELVARSLTHEPIQYVVGEAWFYSLPFFVDKRVLIPRQCSGVIMDAVLRHARAEPGFGGRTGEGVLIADVCTGSGALAIALLKNLPAARAVASDLSAEALEVARRNAERHAVADRLDLIQGDLLAPVREFPTTRGDRSLHYLVSNPPYIPDHEWGAVEKNVKDFEPHLALRGGADGMTLVSPLIEQAPALVRANGLILIEVASCNAAIARDLMAAQPGIESAEVLKDLEGLDRVLVGRRGKD
jgi:release factor glutamine methyltransferase